MRYRTVNFTIMLVWGDYGGWYVAAGRICLGRLALTFIPVDVERCMYELMEERDEHRLVQ